MIKVFRILDMKPALTIIFCISLLTAIGSAVSFALDSGFFTAGSDGPLACQELQSAGSDDELAMTLFVVLLPSLLYRALRWRDPLQTGEVIFFGGALTLASVATTASLDCGSFFYTAFRMGNPYLFVFVVSLLVAVSASFISVGKQLNRIPTQTVEADREAEGDPWLTGRWAKANDETNEAYVQRLCAFGDTPMEIIKALRADTGMSLDAAHKLVVSDRKIEIFLTANKERGVERRGMIRLLRRVYGCTNQTAIAHIDQSGLWRETESLA